MGSQALEKENRGRSRSMEKREAILQAAREILLEQGYAEASMDQITARAGVSKATVYGHFATKAQLFEAIGSARAEHILTQLKPFSEPSGDPKVDLEHFAVEFQRFILRPEARAWDRLVISEVERNPGVALSLYQAGPAKVLAFLQGYLREETRAGRLKISHPDEAAEEFMGLVLGLDLIRGLIGIQESRSESQIRDRASRAVHVFLSAYGTGR